MEKKYDTALTIRMPWWGLILVGGLIAAAWYVWLVRPLTADVILRMLGRLFEAFFVIMVVTVFRVGRLINSGKDKDLDGKQFNLPGLVVMIMLITSVVGGFFTFAPEGVTRKGDAFIAGGRSTLHRRTVTEQQATVILHNNLGFQICLLNVSVYLFVCTFLKRTGDGAGAEGPSVTGGEEPPAQP